MQERVPKPKPIQPPLRRDQSMGAGKTVSQPGRYDWYTGGGAPKYYRENFMTGGKPAQRKESAWGRQSVASKDDAQEAKQPPAAPVVQRKPMEPQGPAPADGSEHPQRIPSGVTVVTDRLQYAYRTKPIGVESSLSFADRHLSLMRDIVLRTDDGREIHLRVQGRTNAAVATQSMDAKGRTGLRMQVDVKRDDGKTSSDSMQVSDESADASLNKLIPLCAAAGGFGEVLLRPGAVSEDFVAALVAKADRILPAERKGWGENDLSLGAGEGLGGAAWGSDRDGEFIDLGTVTNDGSADKGIKPWGELSEQQKQDEMWKVFWEEFSWTKVVAGILLAMGLLALLQVLRNNPVTAAVLIGGVAVGMIIVALESLLSDLLEGVNPTESEWIKGGLVVIIGVFALAGIALAAPEAVAVVEAGGLFTVFALAVVEVVSAVADFQEGKAAPTREVMRESVKRSAHSAEDAIIAAGTVALAPAAKPLRKMLAKWRKSGPVGAPGEEALQEEGETVATEFKAAVAAFKGGGVPQMDQTYLIQKGIVMDVIEGRTLLTTTARKGNFGEMNADVEMVDKGWTPRHQRVTDIDAPPAPGIDHVFTKPGPPEIILVVDSKYGTARLARLADGTRQMSDVWIERRLYGALGDAEATRIIENGYSALVAKVKADGSVAYRLLDGNGNVIGSFNP